MVVANEKKQAWRKFLITAVMIISAGFLSGTENPMSTPYNVSGTVTINGGTFTITGGTLNLTPVSPAVVPQPLPSQTAIGTGANAQAWATVILQALNAPVNSANINSLVGWFGQEDNHGQAGQQADGIGANNPLSITADTPGITGSNGSVPSGASGPPNLTFPTVAAGVNAIVEALASYPVIKQALVSGVGMIGNSAVSPELSEWSGGGYNTV